MNSADWAKVWVPLAVELIKAGFVMIFGTEKQKKKRMESTIWRLHDNEVQPR